MIFGPDGGIYWQSGVFMMHNHEHPWGPSLQSSASAMYRFDPRRFTIAMHAPNSPNPHGIAFDYWGYHYATDGTGGRAVTIADELLAMIDDFLLKFEEALKEGRVRTDSAADVNTLVRLKQFIQGGADSRQEVRSILSLEALQERYARAQRESESTTTAMAGAPASGPSSA